MSLVYNNGGACQNQHRNMKKLLKSAILKSLMFHHQDLHSKLELLEESQEYIKKKLETIEKVLIKHHNDDMF